MGRTVTRWVQVERDGKSHTVPQDFPVPRDWDAIALGAVRVAASLAVAGAVTWSTVAIGDLLAGVAPTWAAYLVAGVFDLAWIICMVLEWLCRYDRSRARTPIVCGWLALGVSVSLIALHGASHGVLFLGICGGAVSAIAKGIWTVVMRHTAVAMDKGSQAWLDAERQEVNSALAVTAARRQLARTDYRRQSELYALSAGQRDNFRTPAPELDRTADNLSARVPDSGQDKDRTPDSRTGQGQPDRTPVRDSPADRLSELSGRQLPRAFVRGLLSADPSLSNQDLSAALRAEYGQDMTDSNIHKTIQRARGDLSRAV